jgi:poly-gamma-glutamate synthesis protein (capsule biosynthesis protein)
MAKERLTINQIDLPRDARNAINFKALNKTLMKGLHLLADIFGFWRYPSDRRMDIHSIIYLTYWIYRTINPITRARKSSGLEDYFQRRRRKPVDLIPRGFEKEKELSLSFVGDLMSTRGVENSKDRLYESVSDLIFEADLVSANLESTLTREEITGFEINYGDSPLINLTPDQYQALIQHHGHYYDIVQLANNHILDCGEEGLSTTRERLERDQVAFTGINGSPAAARRGTILERGGLKIGWVSFTYSVNFREFPAGKRHLVNMVPFLLEDNPETAPILEQLRWCREQGCDLVVLGLHWGNEFELFPHPDQLTWAHAFAEAGADIIVGHHPHVPQPMEFYRTQRDPGRYVPIIYSLGNLTPILSCPASALSLVARLKVAQGRLNGTRQTYVSAVDLTPVAIMSTLDGGAYRPRVFELAEILGMELDQATWRYVSEIASYADLVLGRSRPRNGNA